MSIAQLRRSHNRRHEVAAEIADHLNTFEGDLARALASGSKLVGFLPGARADAAVSAVVGQDAIHHFVSSLRLISKAMDRAVDGHQSLDQTRQRLRVPIQAGGDKVPIPPISAASQGFEAELAESKDD
ncbi:MAG: hypothetical protein DI568_16405 [Sphingomonas sp.]|nr:MAG: hypothetical protein DI568_16405 [Sphingomonas sp.]